MFSECEWLDGEYTLAAGVSCAPEISLEAPLYPKSKGRGTLSITDDVTNHVLKFCWECSGPRAVAVQLERFSEFDGFSESLTP